ncbi:hypothetical protein [Rhodoblastus sp.]|uniref:hypothetical protein n=1 Tax=Rhodoblastus sp. TaxID=1962975 RepID=UPI003F94DCE0
MDRINRWKRAEELTVYQISLLLAGHGGHIGLFMGARTLKEHWPPIGRWIVEQSA